MFRTDSMKICKTIQLQKGDQYMGGVFKLEIQKPCGCRANRQKPKAKKTFTNVLGSATVVLHEVSLIHPMGTSCSSKENKNIDT